MKFDKDLPEKIPHVKRKRWDKKKCKRNSGGDHDMVFLESHSLKFCTDLNNKEKSWDWEVWKCSLCGKVEYTDFKKD